MVPFANHSLIEGGFSPTALAILAFDPPKKFRTSSGVMRPIIRSSETNVNRHSEPALRHAFRMNETCGERIKRLREAAGFETGTAFAAAIDIKPSTLSEIETGQSNGPSAPVLIRMSNVLRFEAAYILNGDEPAIKTVSQLRDHELQLLILYRDLNQDHQRDLHAEATKLFNAERPDEKGAPRPLLRVVPLVRRVPKSKMKPGSRLAPSTAKKKRERPS